MKKNILSGTWWFNEL